MNLSEYLPLIGDTMRIYINKRGFITTDQINHMKIFKLALVHYWQRFSKCVEQDFLWSIIKNISTTDVFEFNLNGEPHNAPAAIDYIVRKERERHIILSLNNRRTILPNVAIFITCACFASIMLIGGSTVVRANLSSLYNSLVVRPTSFVTNNSAVLSASLH